MEDDTGVWCTGLKNGLAEEIGDVTELHSGFNVGAALDEGIEDAFDIARDIDNFLEPDWVLDRVRFTWEHFQSAHRAEGTVNEKCDVIGLDGSCVTSFYDD